MNRALIPVWRMRWVQRRTLDAWHRAGVPCMPAARLESMVNEALQLGLKQGELQGRANLRADIESGVVPPITRSAG